MKGLITMTAVGRAACVTAYLNLDPEAHRNPQEFFDVLREEQETLYRDPATGFYVVSNPDVVREIFSDHGTYSSADLFGPGLVAAVAYIVSTLTEEQRQYFISPVETMITSGGETHRRLRKAVNPFFTRSAIGDRHASTRARIDAILDGLPDEVDWVQDFCSQLTVRTIADLIGIPDSDFATIVRWNQLFAAMATGANLTPNIFDEYIDFTKEFTLYFRAMAVRVRENPDSNLLSHLLDQGDDLTERELMQMLMILFIGGTATTTETLRYVAIRIAEDAALIDGMRTHPETIPGFVEECIAELSPSTSSFRTALRPTILQGTEVPEGAILLLVIAAANQDIADRDRHLAFGHGVHKCLGQHLARIEVRAAVEAMVERYDKITLTQPLEELTVYPHLLIPSHPNLYVRLDRRKRPT
jgi:cytochrome P450